MAVRVAIKRCRGAFGDLRDLHAREGGVVAHGLRGKHRLLRAEHGVGISRDRIRVGEIGRDGAQPNRLRVHRRTGDVEDGQVAHGARASYWPVIAVSIERTFDSMKESEARYSTTACA